MDVNADFSKRVLLHGDSIPWEDSPMAGVVRRRLDRVDTEDERVTTIVRYAPGSQFSSHVHTGGEEFIVLDGIFQDDYGDWPAGSYVRNPPQSSHTPRSAPGCTIFVKLWQFAPSDRTFVHANRHKLGAVPDRDRPGVNVSPLYEDEVESVRFEHWEPNATVTVDATGGGEIFVLEGGFTEAGDVLREQSWLRVPVGTTIEAIAGARGTDVWIKTNHLRGL
ncbi:MAG: cupin domain-containing protein [Gammaproteobacteria bacterium]|nr:cupin domain-containing protein [Gammaproteobacteria bacterium]